MAIRLRSGSAAAALAALAGLALACEASKSANPLSPTVAGPIPGVQITAPAAVEPGAGAELNPNQPPLTLIAANASSSGQRPLFYAFEVALDAGFANKVFSKEQVPQGENGRTSVRMSDAPVNGQTYYWRVKAYDGANTGPYSSTANFAVSLPIIIDAPAPLAPLAGGLTDTTRPVFRFRNAPRSGPVGGLTYTLQVSIDQSFAQPMIVSTIGEQPNETSVQLSSELPSDGKFFWRVRGADLVSSTVGPWSITEHFSTPKPAPPPPPPPSPGPGPSPNPAGCRASAPIDVLNCVRSQFPSGPMDRNSLEEFIYRSAVSLNASGVPGGPYGRLVKTTGNNCGGYSCDIICVGQGGGQLQYDVLIDENIPTWGAPLSGPGIRVDACRVP